MKKELIERFIEGKIAINLETQQEWNEFMQWLEENTDIRWYGGQKPTEKNYWNVDKEWTCVNSDMTWGAYNSYESSGYEIVKYKDLKERKGMKTSEFIERVERLGYEVDNISFPTVLRIVAGEDVWIASVETNALNKVDTRYDANIPSELFDLLVEYAKTPIEEREEEKKYHWKLKGGGKLDNDMSHFNYQKSANEWFLSSKTQHLDIATQFTEKEFAELKSKLGIDLEFEKEEENENK